ncbi:MAG: hypothetical protein KAR06_03960, partial [Deltaproteobacteria bacterium]|nr:hypothetical protein [Deltaproteobacteria bacterium]
VQVLSATGALEDSYVRSGGIYEIVQGDDVDIAVDLGADYSGWSFWFALKKYHADAAYTIDPKDVSANFSLQGAVTTGTVPLTATETATLEDNYVAEIEGRYQGKVLTVFTFILRVKMQVITP